MQKKLKDKYKKLMNEPTKPEWALHKASPNKNQKTEELISCSIPFVGKKYKNQSVKILIYASAEALTHYIRTEANNEDFRHLEEDSIAINRHRYYFENEEKQKGHPFFPNIHIHPISNGALLTAAFYLATQINPAIKNRNFTPKEFLETVCVGNYCKYSIETEFQKSLRDGKGTGPNKNIDYASDKEKLAYSHDFIKADFETLLPDVVILPKTIYNTDKAFLEDIRGDAILLPVYQLNAGVINRILKKKAPQKDLENLPNNVRTWYDELLKNKTMKNYNRVFSHLDAVLNEYWPNFPLLPFHYCSSEITLQNKKTNLFFPSFFSERDCEESPFFLIQQNETYLPVIDMNTADPFLQRWIQENKPTLLQHWNGEISDKNFLNCLYERELTCTIKTQKK